MESIFYTNSEESDVNGIVGLLFEDFEICTVQYEDESKEKMFFSFEDDEDVFYQYLLLQGRETKYTIALITGDNIDDLDSISVAYSIDDVYLVGAMYRTSEWRYMRSAAGISVE
jgi:hypothetical protein